MSRLLNKTHLTGCLHVIIGSIIITCSPFFVEFSHLDAFTSTFYRLAIGGIILSAIAFFRKDKFPYGFLLYLCAFAAIVLGLDLIMWNQSVIKVGSGLATTLSNLEVIFMVLIGAIWFHEKISLHFIVSCGCVCVGILLLINPYLVSFDRHAIQGVLLALSASFIYSLYLFCIKLISIKNSDKQVTIVSILGIICLFASLAIGTYISISPERSFLLLHKQDVLSVLFNGIFTQVIGWLFITSGVPRISFSLSGILMLTQPALTYCLDCIFLRRNTENLQILGCIIILGTIFVTSQKTIKAKRVKT